MTYEERLSELELPKLEDRRRRGDMIETYKILTGKEDIEWSKFFKLTMIRGARNNTHEMKIEPQHCRLDVRKYFYSQRVGKPWNSLSPDEVGAEKTSVFKEKYDEKEAGRNKVKEKSVYVYG